MARIEWSEAEAAVGTDDPSSDWILRPAEHANNLPSRAAALKRALEQGVIVQIIERYSKHDAEAGRQQKRYRSGRMQQRGAALFSAGTGILALSMHFVLGYSSDLQLILVLLHVFGLAYLIGVTVWINNSDPRKSWLEERGKAELLRVALFDQVLAAREPADPQKEIALLPLQLAYFRRYQLDVQLRYYRGRGRELLRATGLPPWFTSIALFVAIVAFLVSGLGLAQILAEHGYELPGFWVELASPASVETVAAWVFATLFLSTLYAILLSNQDVSEEQRLASRYLKLYNNFDYLKSERYELVRLAAEQGDREMVESFVALIHKQMAAEHAEWVNLQTIVDNDDVILARSAAGELSNLFGDRLKALP